MKVSVRFFLFFEEYKIQKLHSRVDVVVEGQAVLAGIHAEGPIISDCGGLPASHLGMTSSEFEQVLAWLGTSLKVMTISPSAEAKVGYARLRVLLDHGVVPAFGHDKHASEGDILGALRVCAEHLPPVRPHITHLFNVSSFHHRLPSLANFGMVHTYPNEPKYQGLAVPTIEVVGDMLHVAPLTMAAILQCRGVISPVNQHLPSHDAWDCGVAIVTDAVTESPSTDSGNPTFTAEGRTAAVLLESSTIAGSCTNMMQIFQSLVRVLRVPIPTAAQMLSSTPATIAKIKARVGSIAVGKRADIFPHLSLLLD